LERFGSDIFFGFSGKGGPPLPSGNKDSLGIFSLCTGLSPGKDHTSFGIFYGLLSTWIIGKHMNSEGI